MIRAIIIDDDPKGREFLSTMVRRLYADIEISGTASDASEGLESIKKNEPQLVFLDVEMPGKNGFDLLNELGVVNFELIFITGHDEYAVKAFRFNAIDYLLKPVDIDELKMAIDKARKRIETAGHPVYENFQHLLSFLKNIDNPFNKIAIPTLDGLIFLRLDEIVHCKSEGNYTIFFLDNNQKIISSKTLKEYEELTSAHNFYRVHKSHLINLRHMKRYIKGEGGTVLMSNAEEIEVSRQKKEEFLRLVKKLKN